MIQIIVILRNYKKVGEKMINIQDKKNCTSCFACYNICPKNAIIMKEDKEGFKYPVIDEEKCVKCGLCEKVCPVINSRLKLEREEKPEVYAAWSKDEFTRIDSTSGGVFSEFARNIYHKGGYVCGAIYNKENMVEHILSNDENDLDNIRSSKYLQSDINNIYKKIKEKLEADKIVLMCGSPCQIAGLYNFLGKEYVNLYTCDFICRGMNSPKIFKGYLKSLESKYNSKVKKIKFKNKIHGWHNFSTRIDFENGKKYIGGRYVDSYMLGYLRYNAFMRPSCYDCKFKGLPKKSDITLADFWGIENIAPEMDENKGTSMILINSSKGKLLFDEIKANIKYKQIKSDKVFKDNVCNTTSPEKTEARRKVFENIDNMTYEELNKKFFPCPNMLKKIKIAIRENQTVKKIRKMLKNGR